MKKIVISFFCLLCSLGLAQQIAEEALIEGILGVDMCALFTLEELQEITGFELVDELDHDPNVSGYFYGDEFLPENYGGRFNETGVAGFFDWPYNGRKCIYQGPDVIIQFNAETNETLLFGSPRDPRVTEVFPNVFKYGNHCYTNPPLTVATWIQVQVTTSDIGVSGIDIACQIIIDGSVGLRAMGVDGDLLPYE